MKAGNKPRPTSKPLLAFNPSILANARPRTVTREERARGGRARAAKARERRASLRHDPRSSARLVEAAQRLGEMLRELRTAMWADNVVSEHILGEGPRFVL